MWMPAAPRIILHLSTRTIKQVYHKLFDKALDEYNAKQKRKDRQIKSYYEKISRSKQEKLFYEVIVEIGNKDDTKAETQ